MSVTVKEQFQLALTEIFRHDAWKGKKNKPKGSSHANSLNLASDMLQDFLLNKLDGADKPEMFGALLTRYEPNGVLKVFTACLQTIKKPEVIMCLLEQMKPIVTFMLSDPLLLKLFENLLMLGTLTYDP